MRLALLIGEARGQGNGARLPRNPSRARPVCKIGMEHEARLPAAHQFQIDFRQKFAVEQRAMLGAA